MFVYIAQFSIGKELTPLYTFIQHQSTLNNTERKKMGPCLLKAKSRHLNVRLAHYLQPLSLSARQRRLFVHVSPVTELRKKVHV